MVDYSGQLARQPSARACDVDFDRQSKATMTESGERTMDLQGAIQEAGRCLLCDEAPCSTGCGADSEPATFIRQLRLGNIKGAVRTLRKNNILAATCAQVCPTCRLCVQGCARSGIDEPIRIAELQAFLADYERQESMQVLQAPAPGDRKVAVIGAGPAGLSAAANLALMGYATTVFEKMPEPGGLLRYGIPDHRLRRDLLDQEIDQILKLGVRFECGHPISTRAELEGLLQQGFDAVFVAPGCDRPYSLGLADQPLAGVFSWVDFLAQSKDSQARTSLAAAVAGKNVVVIGGGAVAMDCAVTAKHLGADRVYAVSLEAMEELPADEDEKELAFEAGIRFKPNGRVVRIIGDNGMVKTVQGVEIRWLQPGRFVPDNAVDVPGSEFSIPADIVVEAIGAGLSAGLTAVLSGLDTDKGRPVTDSETMRLSDPRIFGGGDVVAPGKTVAASVRDGKKAAAAIAEAFPLRKTVAIPRAPRPSLEIDFCGLRCPNPFFLSSSPVSNTGEMIARAFDAGWGGAVYKTLNLERDFVIIDPTPRLNALHRGDQRFVGLQNMEQTSERPLADNLKDIARLKKMYPDRILIVSVMGYSDEGWSELARSAESAGADMIELNYSCPQMACEGAGYKVGQAYDLLERYTRVVKESVSIPVMPKLTPNTTDMLPAAMACMRAGADALSTINTVRAITELDLETLAPKPTIQGRGSISGLSGAVVKPIALRFVAELSQNTEVTLPISAIGGIETWRDAAMFLLLGATNLQVTTGVMRYGYRIVESLSEGLEDYLETRGLQSITELVGASLEFIVEPGEHHQTRHVVAKVDPDQCIGCGLCHVVCHDGANQAMAFDSLTRKAKADEDRCVGCLLCQHVCPVWSCIGTAEVAAPVISGMHSDAVAFGGRN
jgi:dihydropyrimidine dehydrogenase (NAD+) subunit PreA